MGTLDTSMGGPERVFPATRWSLLRGARDATSPAHQEAINHLCHLYWKPVYAYICAVRRLNVEDAKDLTQEFFVELIEGGMLARFVPEMGSFRSYLRGAIKLFLLETHERRSTLKRGGGRKILSLDDDSAPPPTPGSERSPEESFDLQWAQSVLHHAVEELREELVRGGKGVYFAVFDRFELNPPTEQPATYAPIAAEFGLKETDVANYLKHCRKRLRMLILERIRDYVANEEEVDAELAQILRLVSGGSK